MSTPKRISVIMNASYLALDERFRNLVPICLKCRTSYIIRIKMNMLTVVTLKPTSCACVQFPEVTAEWMVDMV